MTVVVNQVQESTGSSGRPVRQTRSRRSTSATAAKWLSELWRPTVFVRGFCLPGGL